MNTGQTVCTLVMARIPHWEFQRAYAARGVPAPCSDALSPLEHFLTMGFAQMTFRESLREIEAYLNAHIGLAYHFGDHQSLRPRSPAGLLRYETASGNCCER
jgi:hypothetical protein